jgi:hypothetical protein
VTVLTDVAATVGALLVAVGGASLSAAIWRRSRRERDPLGECGMGLFGLMGTSSVTTLALYGAWTGSFELPVGTPELGDPFFSAMLLGTVAGHVALIAWARGVGASLALRKPEAAWWALGAIVGALGVVCSLLWTWLATQLGIPVPEQGLVGSVLAGPGGASKAGAFAFIVFGAPVLEELVFRGFLQGCLALRIGPAGAAAASAVMFGLFHLADPQVVPALVVIGALLAWLRLASGSVFPSMIGHIVNNAIALTLALATAGS